MPIYDPHQHFQLQQQSGNNGPYAGAGNASTKWHPLPEAHHHYCLFLCRVTHHTYISLRRRPHHSYQSLAPPTKQEKIWNEPKCLSLYYWMHQITTQETTVEEHCNCIPYIFGDSGTIKQRRAICSSLLPLTHDNHRSTHHHPHICTSCPNFIPNRDPKPTRHTTPPTFTYLTAPWHSPGAHVNHFYGIRMVPLDPKNPPPLPCHC